jgi:hypothetical protein
MLIHCKTQQSRPPDLKKPSKLNLPIAWITGPATDPSFIHLLNMSGHRNADQHSTVAGLIIIAVVLMTFAA